jgi:large subunit ribosomal protein L32
MAHPKRKQSKQRRDKRRTHDKAVIPTIAKCSNCSSTVLYHRVCPTCGYYKGKLAIEKEGAAA